MAKSAAAKKPSKQLPLFEVQPVTEAELMTDAERQELYRLRQLSKDMEHDRHVRWMASPVSRIRPCPCAPCVKLARKRT